MGKTTLLLDTLEEGDAILDFVGPLGRATELEGHRGWRWWAAAVGCAIAYPEAKAFHEAGARWI